MGTAAAAITAAPATAEIAAGAEYTTVTIPANSTENIYVDDGETYENVLIDMTADGASAQLLTRGSGWTIRNVGFKGTHPGGHYLLSPGVASAGGTGLIENVYLGDGQEAGTAKGGVWINANLPHRGTITFRNFHVAGMVDNGLYGSGPGAQGYCGNHHVESSYFFNNTISNNRTNGDCRTCEMRDSVVYVDGNNPACGTGCSAPGATTTRGVWAWYGETIVENCDIRVVDGSAFATKEGGYFTTNNVRTGSAADVTPPDSVPMTAEEAASGSTDGDGGGGGGGGGTPDSGTITFHGGDSTSAYRFGAGGGVTGQSNVDSDGDAIYANETASGSVLGGNDSYDFTGSITFCNVHGGDATVSVDGSTVNPDDLGRLQNTVSVDSTDSNTATDYTLSVSDQLEKSTHNSATIDSDDTIANGTADGSVQGGADSYRFSGEITAFDYTDTGSFVLYVDGQQTDPDTVGSGSGSGTVLDDFEDGDISEYSGQTSGYGIQSSTTLEGSYTLECTGTYYDVAHGSATTSRGNEYRCRVRAASGSAAEPSLLVAVQDATSPMQDNYWAFLSESDGQFKLNRRDGGSTTTLDSVSFAFQEATTYEVAVELGSDTVKAVLYDGSGTVVAETATISDSTHTGGTFGFYTGGGTPAYYDYVAENPL